MFIDNPYTIYTGFQRNGVICLSVAALVSLLAILLLLIFKRPKQKEFQNGHIFGYFISLLVANAIQAFGTVLDFAWVGYNAVMLGGLCNLQGGIKHFGNITNAVWSLMISIQLFNLLFHLWPSSAWEFWFSIAFGWGGCLLIVFIGPSAVQKPGWPSYFGPDGAWCWISGVYRTQQIFLEYLLQYLSVGISLILYTFIILRVRGNLIKHEGKWQLRKVPTAESWRPCYKGDPIDTQLVRMARLMVWFPIAYFVCLIPVSVTRFVDWSGKPVPFESIIMTEIVFTVMGFVNVLLILFIEHLFPDIDESIFVNPKTSTKGNHKRTLSEKIRRERAIYLPYPERAHFPAFQRKLSADSNASDESWGNLRETKDYV